jgi:hypothetical protein
MNVINKDNHSELDARKEVKGDEENMNLNDDDEI